MQPSQPAPLSQAACAVRASTVSFWHYSNKCSNSYSNKRHYSNNYSNERRNRLEQEQN